MTHRGHVREVNEDHFLVADLERAARVRQTSLPIAAEGPALSDAEGTLLMVADGMGGHGDGELASAVTLDTVLEHVVYAMPTLRPHDQGTERELAVELGAGIVRCQERLRQVAARKGASPSLGTTLTLAYVRWPDVYVAHVGDSRLYHWRDGKLAQVTRDHTLAQQLREEYGAGDDVRHFDHVLVNAIGGDGKAPEVEAHHLRLLPGDRLLLCTDGLYGELPALTISGLLGGAQSPAEACHRLVSAALHAGGRDNVTTVVAFF
jgi:protein phosphatase